MGPRAFTSGVITTAVLLFPPVGAALLGVSVLQAIWQEIDPKWKTFVVTTAKTTVKASQKGVEAGAAIASSVSATWKFGEDVTSEAGKHLENTANTVNSMFKGWTKKTGN